MTTALSIRQVTSKQAASLLEWITAAVASCHSLETTEGVLLGAIKEENTSHLPKEEQTSLVSGKWPVPSFCDSS